MNQTCRCVLYILARSQDFAIINVNHMLFTFFGHGCSVQGQAWTERHPLAVSAATGSASLKDPAFGYSG